MRGIQVAIALGIMRCPPRAGAAVGVPVSHLPAKIVDISGLPMQQLADHALSTHVEKQQLLTPVVDVFHHHAMPARRLGRIDDIPQLLNRWGEWYLDKGVRSEPHRCHRHLSMQRPRCRDEYGIGSDLFEHLFPGAGAAVVQRDALMPPTTDFHTLSRTLQG